MTVLSLNVLQSPSTSPMRYLILASLYSKGTELWVVFYSWHEVDFFFSFDRDVFL